MDNMEEIRLVYFDIRGLAEPARWMMKIAGIEFIDERISLDAWEVTRRKGDNLIKQRKSSESGTAPMRRFVGQLPIIFVGDFVLTQPLAVIRYLAKRCGFAGDTEWEESRAEEISDLVYDLRLKAIDYLGKAFNSRTPDIVRHTVFRDFRGAPDSPDKSKMRDDFRLLHFPLYFSKFNDILVNSGGEWIGGAGMTYGDLVLANFLDIAQDLVDPECLMEFPNLTTLMKKVFEIPQIAEWRRTQGAVVGSKAAENN